MQSEKQLIIYIVGISFIIYLFFMKNTLQPFFLEAIQPYEVL
jgi:hypothetical protein